ncbi:MAG: PAN domain-containing protein [Kofleriaceae bacterium]
MPDDFAQDLATPASAARPQGPPRARRARAIAARAVAVAAVAAVATSACVALMGRKLTPEEQACRSEAMKAPPDVTGRWETADGTKLDVRPGYRGALTITVAADGTPPPWTVQAARLSPPEHPVCGGPWELRVFRQLPTRGEHVVGALASSADRLTFGGEVWTRTGAAVALALPAPGMLATQMDLIGTDLDPPLSNTNADACQAACMAAAACVGFVLRGDYCKLKATVDGPRSEAFVVAWIKPGDAVGPVALPGAGSPTRSVRLSGTPLETVAVGGRGAEHACQVACDARWDCAGYSVETWKGTCELLREVHGSTPGETTWVSWIRPTRVAAVPAPETYAENTDLTGASLSVTKLGWKGLRGCHDLCKADVACRAFVWSEATTECTLKRTVGEARVAEGLTAFAMKPPLVPPPQTMTSPLCAAPEHQAEPAIYGLTTQLLSRTDPATGKEIYLNSEGPYLTTTADPATGPAYRLATQVAAPAFLLPYYDGTRLFTVRPVPGKGTVHIHSYTHPDLVLKRVGVKVVVGPVDAASEWRIEHLWEHADPPATGVWYVLRSTVDGAFLGTDGEGVALFGSPAGAGTHWRFHRFGGNDVDLPVQDPEPLKLDLVVVDKLAAWILAENIRQEQPACWKQSLNDGCPATGQPTSCGAFCAQNTAQCVLDVANMVESVTEVAANVAGLIFTGGTANVALKAATTAAKAGGKAAAKAALKQAMKTGGRALTNRLRKRTGARVLAFLKSRGKSASFKQLAKSMAKDFLVSATGKLAVGVVQVGAEAYGAVEQERAERQLLEAYAEAAHDRAAERLALKAAAGDDPDLLEIAAMVDPTGVSGVVAAFVKPMCVETPWPDLGP